MNEIVQEAVRQWLSRAKADWETVKILSSHSGSPPESICFHCQQYVEKLLKAILTLNGIESPKTHDVRRLVQLAVPLVPELSELLDPADLFTECAVALRYPDEWRETEPEEVQNLVVVSKQFADLLLPKLV
jgi:HEPN domain-containing protein